ncbi:hypothetical protein D9757_004040 [Collybiopsis confluens]|uniref:Uncharacterized protein n=1 Tax=Collybiopsis confluens TaxID=2823264 RepID=A0A8H5HWS8_9AGAR|nr:hypothetical protein D9757_004040 [Collybiopsis confluens]
MGLAALMLNAIAADRQRSRVLSSQRKLQVLGPLSLPAKDMTFHFKGNVVEKSVLPLWMSSTLLSPVIENIPLGILQVGQGVDALTGEARSVPWESFNAPNPSKGLSLQHEVQVLEQLDQLNTDVEIGSNATINIGTRAISAVDTANSWKSYAFSEKKLTIECRVDGQYEYDMLDIRDLQLSPQAQELLKSSPESFRSKYGDYFVAGVRRRFRAYMLVVYELGENTKTTDARLEALESFKRFLDTGTNANKAAVDSSKYTALHTYLYEYGCYSLGDQQSKSVSLSVVHETDLGTALSALKAAASSALRYNGIPKDAILWHYRRVLTINLSVNIFKELHTTERECTRLDLYCFHPALDTYHTVRLDAQKAIETFRSSRPMLVLDSKRREEAIGEVTKAMKAVNQLLQRYELLAHLLDVSEQQPAIEQKVFIEGDAPIRQSYVDLSRQRISMEQKIAGRDAPGRRSYGEVKTTTVKETYQSAEASSEDVTLRDGLPASQITLLWGGKDGSWWKKARLGRHNNTTFTIGQPLRSDLIRGQEVRWELEDFLIVGWTISYGGPSHSSFCVKSGGIMKSHLSVAVDRLPWRCCIVYVLKKDYNFPSLF